MAQKLIIDDSLRTIPKEDEPNMDVCGERFTLHSTDRICGDAAG